MKTAIRAAFVAAVLLLPIFTPAMPPDEARAWRDDLQFMSREMQRLHKNLYHTVSPEKFEQMVSSLDAWIPQLERHEVIVAMAKIVAAVGDGHTNIYPTRDAKIGFHTLPVALTFFGDELYVRAAHESQRSLAGARVVRIGNRSAGDAYLAVRTMIGRDNEQGARYWAPYLLAMPEVLHALRITTRLDRVPLTLATKTGDVQVELKSFAPVEIMSGDIATLFNRREWWVDVRDAAGRPDPVWLRSPGEPFRFEHVGRLFYVQINTIGDTPDESLAQFAARVHDEIAATKPEKVAFDLRLNRGGNGSLLPSLIRAIIQSESIDCRERLFVIIGPGTFSAAQMFVNALERYTQATFVGEPTSSKGNAYGDSRKIVLPHSGITVRASIYYWQEWHPMDDRDATTPAIPALLSFEAYSNNSDPALDAILASPENTCP